MVKKNQQNEFRLAIATKKKNAMAPMQGIVINAVAAVMDYALWLFFKMELTSR